MKYKNFFLLICYFSSLNCVASDNDNTSSLSDAALIGGIITTAGVTAAFLSQTSSTNHNEDYPSSFEPCSPQPVAQCDNKCIQNVQKTLDQIRQKNNIPGMQLTISFANQPMQTFCSGTTTKDGNVPIGKNSLFGVGSVTKSFTAAVMLQLEAEGKVSLSSTVKDWFDSSDYMQWDDITVNKLLDMTAGTFDFVDTMNWKSQPFKKWSAKELNDLSYQKGPMCIRDSEGHKYCPYGYDSGWDYSNNNYILVERIIEKASNKTLQENIYQRILKPLNLVNTIYDPDDSLIQFNNIAHGYRLILQSPKSQYIDLTSIPLSGIRGAGALISTSEDLSKWARALFSGKVLPPTQFQEMTSLVCTGYTSGCIPGEPISSDSNENGDGYGIFHQQAIFDDGQPWWLDNKDSTWWHNGAYGGFQSIFLYDEDRDFVITATKNTNDAFWWGELLSEVSKILFPNKL